MNRNDCEAVLHLHRTFRPRRRTGRGFLTGTVFLDAALLIAAFVLSTSHFVLKPGIALDLPIASATAGIQYNDTVLSISQSGLFFFNDSPVTLKNLDPVLRAAAEQRPGAALILEADRATSQDTITLIYDAAARAGFRRIFIATQPLEPATL
ncbi:MAG: ExbD/TolR family protein [Kiritimatiellales bacterium]